MKKPLLLTALALLAISTTLRLSANTWCHDYTSTRVTGQDTNRTRYDGPGGNDLRGTLEGRGYTPYDVTKDSKKTPGAVGGQLRPGDVVIFGNGAHSGYVNPDGTISHYIQESGAGNQGVARPPSEIPNQPNFHGSQDFPDVYNAETTTTQTKRPWFEGFWPFGADKRPDVTVEIKTNPYTGKRTIIWRRPGGPPVDLPNVKGPKGGKGKGKGKGSSKGKGKGRDQARTTATNAAQSASRNPANRPQTHAHSRPPVHAHH